MQGATSATERSVDALFVGNSFTSRNQLPQLIAALAAPSYALHTATIYAGGASLRRHWNAGLAQRTLASQRWDYVVLQEQSTLPIKNAQRYHENVRLYANAIAEQGAQMVLYLTWSRAHAPEAQAVLTSAVQGIAAETGARVVPVGIAWQVVRERHPEIGLYDADGSHPTPAGSYLAACVFAATLFAIRFAIPPGDDGIASRLRIDRDVASRLHQIAWDASQAYAT